MGGGTWHQGPARYCDQSELLESRNFPQRGTHLHPQVLHKLCAQREGDQTTGAVRGKQRENDECQCGCQLEKAKDIIH